MLRRILCCTLAAAAFGTSLALTQPAPSTTSNRSVDVVEASIAGLLAAYTSGQTTARAVTQVHLDRIAAYDKRGPFINSLITVNPRALEEADQLDALLRSNGRPIGPLHGIPVIIKDNIDVAGMPMTSGF
jgi:amidase